MAEVLQLWSGSCAVLAVVLYLTGCMQSLVSIPYWLLHTIVVILVFVDSGGSA
jgi:hypothetical protein